MHDILPLTADNALATASAVLPDSAAVNALAICLMDLRAAHEADLRMLTSVQRSLERIRCGGSTGEIDLLLGEMARVIEHWQASATQIADHRSSAGTLVASLRSGGSVAELAA